MSINNKDQVRWMYEGTKSSVNAEEYLTGRKVDKAFDNSHAGDFGGNESSRLDSVIAGNQQRQRSSIDDGPVLDLETIRKEDPLVAIRVKEEQVRRDIFGNPVKMRRLQRIVRAAMEKKVRRAARTGEMPDFLVKYFAAVAAEHQNDSSSSSDNDGGDDNNQPRMRHIDSDDDDSDADRKKPAKQFGLVHMSAHGTKRHHGPAPQQPAAPKYMAPKRQRLSEHEMERRRTEMLENASWRQTQREERQRRLELDEKREQADTGPRTGQMRPFESTQANVEERLRSNRQRLQRGHDAMERNFARK